MDIAVVDNKHRAQIPGLKPGVVVACVDNGDNTITLTKVTAATKESFPPGSLLKYMTEARDGRMSALAKGMKIPPPREDWSENPV